jgi:hypothetical protein
MLQEGEADKIFYMLQLDDRQDTKLFWISAIFSRDKGQDLEKGVCRFSMYCRTLYKNKISGMRIKMGSVHLLWQN